MRCRKSGAMKSGLAIYGAALLCSVLVFTGCNSVKYVPTDEFLLDKVRVTCNDKDVDVEELKGYIKQMPNRKLLRVFPFHLYVYNLIDPEKEAVRAKERETKLKVLNEERKKKGKNPREKFYFTEWFHKIGEAPVVYDKTMTKKTSRQFRLYLKNKGFYNPLITDTVTFKRRKASVHYRVVANAPYTIRNVTYKVEDPTIFSGVIHDTINSLVKKGALFDVDKLQDERARIARYLNSNGYYYFVKEFVDYKADTNLSCHKTDLAIRIKKPHESLGVSNYRKFEIGNITICVDFDPRLALLEKESYYSDFDTLEYKGVHYLFKKSILLKPDVIHRYNHIVKGNIYNLVDVEKTYTSLSSLKIFKLINIQFQEVQSENINDHYLNCVIQLTPLTTQSYTVELEGTNTSGNFGTAVNFKYQHKSLFKGAEILEMRFVGALQVQSVATSSNESGVTEYLPFNTKELGPDITLHFPKLMLPFNTERVLKKYNPNTNVTIAYNFQQRPDYTRSISNASFGYSWKGQNNVKHFLNPIDLSFIKLPTISDAFRASLNDSKLYYSYEDQLISASNYTFIYSNQNLKKNRSFIYLKGWLETAGNMFTLYHDMAKTPKIDGSYYLDGIKYAQYVKVDLDIRYYQIFNPDNKIVYRLFGGVGKPYLNAEAMPFVKQYFSGGANSIRAWSVRSLGPGTYSNDASIPNQASDVKLEANLEYRFNIFWKIDGAFFVDAGNIWSIDNTDEREGARFSSKTFYKELAVGSGLGIRMDFNFFIFRLDYGLKIIDPQEPEGHRLIPGNKDLTPHIYAWNLAIGYPF